MAQSVKDSFLDLENHRQLLEANIEKLKQSLRHWQIWEAEYEGLKEEILAAEIPPNRTQLVALAQSYEGELVNQKEVKEILGPKTRTAAQVVNLLDRRIDYVEQNVLTVQKQITTAENKIAAAAVISTPDVRNEEGLPVTEIIEELDDEGNVIASRTSTPGSVRPQLLEVLQKAGIKNLSELEVPSTPENSHTTSNIPRGNVSVSEENATPQSTIKSVHFATDVNAMESDSEKSSSMATKLEEIMRMAKQEDENNSGPPVIPTNEPTEDAALRREMLQYRMSEIGSVVAELDLEDGSEWSEEEYDGASTDDEDEDQFGRSTGRVIDNELRDRMIELEQRLGVRMMDNVGQKHVEPEIVREGIGRITVKEPTDLPSEVDKSNTEKRESTGLSSTKKSVRFSEDLDVSPAPSTTVNTSSTREWIPAPVRDIIERSQDTEPSKPAHPKIDSRFKSMQVTAPRVLNGPLLSTGSSLPLTPLKSKHPKPFSQPISLTTEGQPPRIAPTGPEGKTLAYTVVERETPIISAAAAPDELDPHLLRQEVATEYYRQRNRMVQKQGGFMKEKECEIIPFTEEEGGPKKMSRFKAARLARS